MRKTRWRTSVFTKLLATILISSFVPLAIGLYFVSQFLIQYEKENYIKIMQANLKQADSIIQERVGLLKQTATNLARSSAVLALLDGVSDTTTDVQKVETLLQRIVPTIESARLSNKYASTIRLIHANTYLFDIHDIIYYDPLVNSGDWKERLTTFYQDDNDHVSRSYVGQVTAPTDYSGYGHVNQGEQTLSIYASVISSRTAALLGVVEVSLDLRVLTEPLSSVLINQNEVLQMLDRDNHFISNSNAAFAHIPGPLEPLYQGMPLSEDGCEYRLYFQHVPSIDAWLFQYIPENMAGVEKYKYVIASILMLTGAIFVSMYFALYKFFSANIRKLIHGINQVKAGDLSTHVDIRSNDEFGEISTHLNEMTLQINELVQREKLANKLEKQAIYKALESQMKPHFLCNALDFIRMSTQIQGNEEVAHSLALIMEYFNYNMNRNQMTVSIRDELRNVEDFIGIYNLINQNRIEYTIDIAPELVHELDAYTIIKYALQPIVENAVKHAFRHKKEKCFISIDVEYVSGQHGEAIRIGIEDNGGGMESTQVEAVLQSIRGDCVRMELLGDKDYEGIGLRNIYQRMRMAYGEDCDLLIESYLQLGTKITVIVPLRLFVNG